MAHSEDKVREIEEDVRYCYLAQHKELPAKDLLGVISKKVTTIDENNHKSVFHVVVSISQEDYDRITSKEEFCFA